MQYLTAKAGELLVIGQPSLHNWNTAFDGLLRTFCRETSTSAARPTPSRSTILTASNDHRPTVISSGNSVITETLSVERTTDALKPTLTSPLHILFTSVRK